MSRAETDGFVPAALTCAPKRRRFADFFQLPALNFALTNRIPRRTLTLLIGRFSRIKSRLLCRASMAIWRLFAGGPDLDDALTRDFESLEECFIRRLRPGARPIDCRQDVVVSPCDAIVGACGRIDGETLLQAKDSTYTLGDLVVDREVAERHRDGWYVTLRLRSTMYHRFHAPCDGEIGAITYVSGDAYNVNPIALERVPRLFCRNERAVLPITPRDERIEITLVPVAAILVASMSFAWLEEPLDLRYRGPNLIPGQCAFEKGDELGYFRQGSTIIVLASGDLELDTSIRPGAETRVGRPLFLVRGEAPRSSKEST